ncbi:ABC transporter permease [Telmatospirillum sp. J64-1]|uniref:ABC transporter permease n=1 Tax=Telmatospirillum sp. J64-1 TaxID=2502183 RepID=UPI00115E4CD3|nr:ABC transporter permease [Telmatospirillum sp. J64-1]
MASTTVIQAGAAPARPAARRPPPERSAALVIPASAFMLFAYAIPLLLLLIASVRTPGGISIMPFVDFLSDPFNWSIIWNTLRIALITTAVALILGYPMAFALNSAKGWVLGLLLISLILPLSVGVVIKAFSWQILLSSNGIVNLTLQALHITDGPIRLIFTETGLVLGAVNVFLPFMVLPIYSVIRLIDRDLTSAAACLGAGPLTQFLRVTLPLSMPGVVVGVAFVFSMSVAMYVIPGLLMGDRFQTLAQVIGRSYLLLRNESLGSTVSVILLLIAVSVVVASDRLVRRLRTVQ